MDNLDRALEAAERNQTMSGLLEGVKMVAVQFNAYLEQHGCRRIPAVGLAFDPHQHEAIAQEPSTEHAAGIVTRIARRATSCTTASCGPRRSWSRSATPRRTFNARAATPGA